MNVFATDTRAEVHEQVATQVGANHSVALTETEMCLDFNESEPAFQNNVHERASLTLKSCTQSAGNIDFV